MDPILLAIIGVLVFLGILHACSGTKRGGKIMKYFEHIALQLTD